jgi:hypothetical protein
VSPQRITNVGDREVPRSLIADHAPDLGPARVSGHHLICV